MKICIDGTPVFAERAIRRYTFNLIRHIPASDKRNAYIAFYIAYSNVFQNSVPRASESNLKNVICKVPGKILVPLWNSLNFPPLELFTGPVDIFHATDFDVPATRNAKIIFTLHGVSYIEAPHWFPETLERTSIKRLNMAIKKCPFFIAVSENTKKQFMAYSGITDRQTFVVHLGIGDEFRVIPEKDALRRALRKKFGLQKPYILYTGALEKWKNIEGLLEAFRSLVQKKYDGDLILAGPEGAEGNIFREKANASGIESRVHFTGTLPQDTDDLVFLYNGADVFVFPSFVEGFASPPLEAMKCGCPVVTSDVSSLPETVGDAALKINPREPEAIAEAVQKILSDGELKKKLVQKGLERVKQFTWERVARETLAVYNVVYRS